MADLPSPQLVFEESCRRCAQRKVALPLALPAIGDEFDWFVRDFESFRRFMLEDLVARFPERTRWTPADLEVVLVEAFSAVLDQLSDMLDRVTAEATLETARRPDSVRRLLAFIGYDALQREGQKHEKDLEELWAREPERMEAARRAGPRAVHAQRRMVSVEDYTARLEEHPLVNRAQATLYWNGAWPVVQVAVTLANDRKLDNDPLASLDATDANLLREEVRKFHADRKLSSLDDFPQPFTSRMLLHSYIERYRMLGQEVRLQDADPVGIELALSIRVRHNYFQSEVRLAIEEALGRGPTGFFLAGRLRFGEDLHIADIIQVLMALDGVENVCVNRFKRLGSLFRDQSVGGRIVLGGLEIAVCDNDSQHLDRGYFRLNLHGGHVG